MLPVFQNLIYELASEKDWVTCCPSNKIKSDIIQNFFLALGGLHEDKLCETLQALAPTTVKTDYHTSILHIESNLNRLGLSPTHHSQRSRKKSGQITLQSSPEWSSR